MTTSDSEPLIISTNDLLHPEGRRFWLDDSMFDKDAQGLYKPRFSVQEVAKCFFGKGADWLRWRSRPDSKGNHPHGYFILDGKPMDFKRLPSADPDQATARYYTLADIERMAHALAQQGAIDGTRLAHIVLMARTCARLYNVGGV